MIGSLCSTTPGNPNICTGCNTAPGGGPGGITYSTQCNQICDTGYSGSACGTYQSVAPTLATGSGRAIFGFAAGTVSGLGSIPAFIAAARAAVAASAGVDVSRVSVAAIAAGTTAGFTVTVDIASGGASDKSVGNALATFSSAPPTACKLCARFRALQNS